MSVAESTVTPVHAFADRAWEQFLELYPLWATLQGDHRWDDRLDDPGPAGRAAAQAVADGWAAEIDGFSRLELSVEDHITLSTIGFVIERLRESHALRLWEFEAMDALDGPQAFTADLARLQRADDPAELDKLLARLAAYPAWMAAHRDNLAAGLASGRTAAPAVVARCLTQTRRLAETPAQQHPLVLAHADLGPETQSALEAAIDAHVQPALRDWLAMLEEYQPHARAGDGIMHLADGRELYDHYMYAWTTIVEDPVQVHEYGRARLAETTEQAAAIAAELGFAGVPALRAHLEIDPQNHVTEATQLVATAKELVARAEAAAPRWFGRVAREGCDVLAVEPHAEQESPPAFYVPPSGDGSRPGRYFINTHDLASRHLHRMAAMAFHEAVPGHHFQLAIEQELRDLPKFRRFGSRMAAGAFVEGWGLYTERLAEEMGLYHTPLERFGALELQAWRAARLVVDTGMHALGWSRQQSIDLLVEQAGLSRLEAETETDRYIGWPGQALTYMLGQREILDLRARLETRDGDRFDHRAFHDEVIGHGSLALAVLREQLPGWVQPRDH
ncbi:MAG: DUF885 domain-containing protein [Candidatus Limnocylindrales bacterium]